MPRRVLYQAKVVTITSDAIRIGRTVYPIGHLTSVRLVEPAKPQDIGPIPAALTLLATAALFVLLAVINEAYYLLLVSLGCIATVVLMVREASRPHPPKRREPPQLRLDFSSGETCWIVGDESAVNAVHRAAVNAIGLARA